MFLKRILLVPLLTAVASVSATSMASEDDESTAISAQLQAHVHRFHHDQIPDGVVYRHLRAVDDLRSGRFGRSAPQAEPPQERPGGVAVIRRRLCAELDRQERRGILDVERLAQIFQDAEDAYYRRMQDEYQVALAGKSPAERVALDVEMDNVRASISFSRWDYLGMARDAPELFLQIAQRSCQRLRDQPESGEDRAPRVILQPRGKGE